jgi:hypothetical protein
VHTFEQCCGVGAVTVQHIRLLMLALRRHAVRLLPERHIMSTDMVQAKQQLSAFPAPLTSAEIIRMVKCRSALRRIILMIADGWGVPVQSEVTWVGSNKQRRFRAKPMLVN